MSDKISNKKLAIGAGIGLGLGLIGAIAYFYNKKNNKDITAEHAIKVLTEVRDELESVSKALSTDKEIAKQLKGKSFEEKMAFFTSKISFPAIMTKVVTNHGFEEEVFRTALKTTLQNDPVITQLWTEVIGKYEKGLQDIIVDTVEIPNILTPDFVLKLTARSMRTYSQNIYNALKELRDQGEVVNLNNPKLMATLKAIKINDIRKKVYEASGLKNPEEYIELVEVATKKYLKENPNEFGNMIGKLEVQHNSAMQAIFTDLDLLKKMIDPIGAHILGDEIVEIISPTAEK